MKNLKRIYFLPFLIVLFSCKTLPPTLSFPSPDNGLMLFTTPTEFKSKKVQHFSIDITTFSGKEGIQGISSIKYSISIKNLSKSQISNFLVCLENDKQVLDLKNKNFMFSKSLMNNIVVRFESQVKKEEIESLIFGNNLKIHIKDSSGNICETFDAERLEKKLKIIGMSL